MEEKANPELHLLVLSSRAPEAAVQRHGAEELRLHHPGAQVWSGAAGGNVSQPGVPTPHDVSRGYVLGNHGLRKRGHWHGQRRRSARWLDCGSIRLVILIVCVAGCQHPADFSAQYSDARLKLREGYRDKALLLADAGFRESQGLGGTWSWMFRILKAEVLLQQDSPQQVLTLLAPEPPESLSSEFKIRRRALQARALCSLGKPASGNAVFLEAESLLPKQANVSAAELDFARAACILSTNRLEALRYYRQAAELARGTDTFVQANGLLGVGYVLLVNENYDAAIDAFNQALALADYPSIRERALGNLGYSYSQLGDYRRAIGYSRDAAKLAADLGRLDHQEKWLLDLGHENDAMPGLFPGEAESSYSKALSLAKELGDAEVVHRCLHNLTQGALESHDLSKAEDYCTQEAGTKAPESSFN